jgi:prepilin-type N-terminal cleavage/methylation domain-containing protein
MKQKNKKAFTLIELLIVIAIIGILASIIIVVMSGARQKSQIANTLSAINMVQTGLESYFTQTQGYPVSNGWQGYCSNWGASLGDNWIPELAASGAISTAVLPTDGRQSGNGAACNDNTQQIIYYSDGTNYKLISTFHSDLSGVPTQMIDPTRPTSAFGVWTTGGSSF